MTKQDVFILPKPLKSETLQEIVDYFLNRKAISIVLDCPAVMEVTPSMIKDMLDDKLSIHFSHFDPLFYQVKIA